MNRVNGVRVTIVAFATAALLGACSEEGTVVPAGAQRVVDGGSPRSHASLGDASRPSVIGPGIRPAAPYLSALSVAFAGQEGSALVPPFAPDVFDYYVSCAAGTNDLVVSVSADRGATSALLLPTSSPAAPKQTRVVRVKENDAIVAVATAGASENKYWVRCLPHDFPPMDMQAYPRVGTPKPGYYLVGTSGVTPGYAMMLDVRGVPIWYAQNPSAGVDDVDDVVPGSVSFFSTWVVAPLTVVQLSPFAKSLVAPSGTELDSHELQVLENGHYLVLSVPVLTGVDVTGFVPHLAPRGKLPGIGGAGPSPSGGGDAGGFEAGIAPRLGQLLDCEIVEFDAATGAVVWTWNATQHFDAVAESVYPLLSWQNGMLTVDPFHCNSLDVDPENGNLLVSSRNMTAVFYVERPSGRVVWKMGGSVSSLEGVVNVPLADPFIQQHDARLQPGWSASRGTGQVSVFDDQTATKGKARALVLDVDTGLSGEPAHAEVAWQVRAPGYSADRGSFRIYPDGSRLVGWGTVEGVTFTEVDEEGSALLEFRFLNGVVTYRAIKVSPVDFDPDVLRATAGQAH